MAESTFLSALFLVVSLVVLAVASNFVVSNALKIAEFLRIGEVATGFILLSVATSLPELVIAVISSSTGQGAISIGNVFGSNITDVLVVIGLMAFLTGFAIKREEAREFIRLLFMTSVVSIALLLIDRLGAIEGVFLLFLFAGYSYYLIRREVSLEVKERISRRRFQLALLFFAAGALAVVVSADTSVTYAVNIARELSISESYIGATIIALGTSLPELAIDISAVRKGNVKLALGDALGSSMTNLTLILGMTGIVSGVTYSLLSYSGLVLFLLLANILLWYFFDTGRKVGKIEGTIFLMIYFAFILAEFGLQGTMP